MTCADGQAVTRVPAWIKRAEQRADDPVYTGIYTPRRPYAWQHPRPARPASLKISEVFFLFFCGLRGTRDSPQTMEGARRHLFARAMHRLVPALRG